MEKKTETSN